MAPETRSRGAPPEGRVYHSSPSLRQAQFPARRKVIRTYGKQPKRKENVSLKQQTLTQIDFVSSFGEDHVVLSDSEEDEPGGDKENQNPTTDQGAGAEGGLEVAEDPASDVDDEIDSRPKPRAPKRRPRPQTEARKKRRRLSGDEDQEDQEDETTVETETSTASRRKTMGDPPTSSRYQTQTLTQFLGRGSFIAISDSDDNEGNEDNKDNEDNDDNDDGAFQDWLGDPPSPSPRPRTTQQSGVAKGSTAPPKSMADTNEATESCPFREESVIPQTPVKPKVPYPEQYSQTPTTLRIARYGPPDKQNSPLKGTLPLDAIPMPLELPGKPKQPGRNPAVLVIEDSFATESWNSRSETPRNSPRRSQLRASQGRYSPSPADGISGVSRLAAGSPNQPTTHDSGSAERNSQKREEDLENKTPCPNQKGSFSKTSTISLREIPDSDEDDEDDSDDEEQGEGPSCEDGFVAGAETQLVLEELASFDHQPLDKAASPACSRPRVTPKAIPKKPAKAVHFPPSNPNRRRGKPIRRPLHPPACGRVQAPSQLLLLESQRVPLHILQAFPPPSARTDILLPVSFEMLDDLLGGYQAHLCLPYKIPEQVVRFWLYDGALIRYMACVAPGEARGAEWAYRVDQAYELNNPVEGDDMQEEGWITAQPMRRYTYLPPAVVGQLLWNLRHAVFGNDSQPPDNGDDDSGQGQMDAQSQTSVAASPTVSQQVAAQIENDLTHSMKLPPLAPSSTNKNNNIHSPNTNPDPLPPSNPHPRDPPKLPDRTPQPRPSQATTDSQASTPEQQQHQQQQPCCPHQLHHDHQSCASSSLTFQDHGGSSVVLPNSITQPGSSQLLTNSQTLPDSLVRDGPGLPLEIWDSEDEVEEPL